VSNADLPELSELGDHLSLHRCTAMVEVASAMQIAITDEEIVKALVAELVQVMSSAPFAAALKVSIS